MSITLNYAWWWIPAAYTMMILIWSAVLPTEQSPVRCLAELVFVFSTVAIVWAIGGFLK